MTITPRLIFLTGILILILGLGYAGVELATGAKPTDLWVYHGPLGGLVAIAGAGLVLLGIDPSLLQKIPGLGKVQDTIPPAPPEAPK